MTNSIHCPAAIMPIELEQFQEQGKQDQGHRHQSLTKPAEYCRHKSLTKPVEHRHQAPPSTLSTSATTTVTAQQQMTTVRASIMPDGKKVDSTTTLCGGIERASEESYV